MPDSKVGASPVTLLLAALKDHKNLAILTLTCFHSVAQGICSKTVQLSNDRIDRVERAPNS